MRACVRACGGASKVRCRTGRRWPSRSPPPGASRPPVPAPPGPPRAPPRPSARGTCPRGGGPAPSRPPRARPAWPVPY
eukprot:4233488-Prymnesium_polylepis.2